MKEEIVKSVTHIATQTSKLCEKIIGKTLPISSLTIFSHSKDEFVQLKETLLSLGTFYNENNGPRVILNEPIVVGRNVITHLRIRQPDPARPQVGCNDFDVADYEAFKEDNLSSHPNSLILIVREAYEMIEFSDPEFDVLAYVVSK